VGAIVSAGVAAPVPARLALKLPTPAVAEIVPLAPPTATGANFTFATQLEFAGIALAHVVDSSAKGAVTLKDDSGMGVAAGLVIVKAFGALTLLITTSPKS
jgi:hypothetical protein